MSDAINPYSAPTARVEDAAGGEAEAMRKAHINHEAGLRSVGMLYYLGGALIMLASLMGSIGKAEGMAPVAVMLLVAAIGAGQIAVGYGLRRLRPWARIPTIILSVLGLLAIPIGTIISIYVLWLLFAKKGRMLFSPEYQAVIASTPHVKYKTSIVVWIVLALFAGLIVFMVLGFMVGVPR
ncbi:MAG: hypothetical protein EXR31_02480 [Betaproteobacteria bacterium]|nr:hypothetical protein [Betaproteobacteria bacterium]